MTLFNLRLPPPHLPADEPTDKRIVEILIEQAQAALALDDRGKASDLLALAAKALRS